MRTVPKSLATLRKIVNDRGELLRRLSQEELKKLASGPPEELEIDCRPVTIGIIVQPRPSGSLRVVVQGFMKWRFFFGSHVALDGFYMHPNGSVTQLPDDEWYEFD